MRITSQPYSQVARHKASERHLSARTRTPSGRWRHSRIGPEGPKPGKFATIPYRCPAGRMVPRSGQSWWRRWSWWSGFRGLSEFYPDQKVPCIYLQWSGWSGWARWKIESSRANHGNQPFFLRQQFPKNYPAHPAHPRISAGFSVMATLTRTQTGQGFQLLGGVIRPPRRHPRRSPARLPRRMRPWSRPAFQSDIRSRGPS